MNTLKRKLSLFGSALDLVFSAHNAQSAVLIDDFTDFQYALDGIQYSDPDGVGAASHTVTGFSGTDLSNARELLLLWQCQALGKITKR